MTILKPFKNRNQRSLGLSLTVTNADLPSRQQQVGVRGQFTFTLLTMKVLLICLNIALINAYQNVESAWYFPHRAAKMPSQPTLIRTMIQTQDPLEFLQKTLDNVVAKEARDQSAVLAENYLKMYDMSCVQRSFCEVATMSRMDLSADKPLIAAHHSMR